VQTPKILVFAGSIRIGSFNRQLAQAAAKTLALMEADVTLIDLADYPLPLVDENLRKDEGIPENALKLARLLEAHDALFIASPEYNASIPPLVKNTIDWVSLVDHDRQHRIRPFAGLTVALGAASDGRLGGIRCLYHLRAVMMNVGTQVVSEQVSIFGAASAFGEDGMPTEERQVKMLDRTCKALIEYCTPGRGR